MGIRAGLGSRRARAAALVVTMAAALLLTLTITPAGAFAAEEVPGPLGGPPVLGGEAEVLAPGGAQLAAEAQSSSPEAFWARESSQTAYEGLSAEASGRLAAEAFPRLVGRAAGGVGWLPAGSVVSRYVDAHVADVSMPGGEPALVQSAAPLAVRGADGSWAPVDLTPVESVGGFAARRGAVPVRLPKDLSEGVGLPQAEVGLTPLSGSGGGAASGASGSVDGSVVFWGDVSMGADVSAMARLTPDGIDLLTMLASDQSPHALRYRVDMPEGAALTQPVQGGAALVRFAGQTLADIAPPSATDAEGMPVPVSMSVEGDVLTVSVNALDSNYRLPIMVDPEVKVGGGPDEESWFYAESASAKGNFEHYIETGDIPKIINKSKPYSKEEWGIWSTVETNGNSKISQVSVYNDFTSAYGVAAWEALERPGVEYLTKSFTPNANERTTLCAESSCASSAGAQKNSARFELSTTAENSTPTSFELWMENPELVISEPAGTHAVVWYNTTSPEVNKTENAMYNAKWIGPSSGAFEYGASDAGLGVAATNVEVEQAGKWTKAISKEFLYKERKGVSHEGGCTAVECSESYKEIVTYAMIKEYVKDGPNHIRVSGNDPMAGTSSTEHKEGEATLRVDTTAPHGFTVTGLASKENEAHEQEFSLGEIPALVHVQATDGEGTLESSGVKSLELAVDGHEVGAPNGECSPGPCTASAEWTLNGRELGAGIHTLTVQATDRTGNVASKSYTLEVDAASPVGLGPGSVNPQSGDYALEAADVGESGGMGPLAVTRHYDSLNPTEGAEGPLGPQWTISLGSLASLEVLPDGSVMVVGPEGLAHFNKAGGSFTPPPGDSNLTLTYVEKNSKGEAEYLLQNKAQGETTRFTLPEGAKSWMPTVSEGPVATDTMTDSYKTAEVEGKKIVEPTLELAPHPTATCSLGKLERGCRALEFGYAETTTATGEAPSEWGEYRGHLSRAYFIAWSAGEAKMKTVEVARYQYDGKGRLRAEWNPSIEPALKTTYGYDEEGHVTAISPAGQEPWLIHYGIFENDPSGGRALSAVRPKASVALGSGKAPVMVGKPELSVKEPAIGAVVSVSQGRWENSPLTYSYQWELCNASGGECKVIPGAVNAGYRPTEAQVGHSLVAQVYATNAGGTTRAVSNAGVVNTVLYYSTQFGGFSSIEGLAAAGSDMWDANSTGDFVQEVGPFGEIIRAYGEKGSGQKQFISPKGIAVDSSGNVWVADTGNNRIQELTSTGEFVRTVSELGTHGKFKEPVGVAVSPSGNVWVADTGNNRLVELSSTGEYVTSFGTKGTENGQIEAPKGLAVNAEGDVWVAEGGANSRVQEFTPTGGYLAKYVTLTPLYVAIDGSGYVWVSTEYGIKKLSSTGTLIGSYGKYGTGNGEFVNPKGIAAGANKTLWVADKGNSRIQVFTIPTVSEGALEAPSEPNNTISTIEYNVPLSGSGLPTMTSTAVGKWAQKDVPAYAAAVFPPEEPQGWPANGYQKATIYYLDSHARTVNAAAPSGGIATTEYNESNAVVRALSADSRATALKEASPAAASERLDTRSVYNAEGSELLETTGPEHKVKLASGEEVSARNHVRYFYDEGAPKGEEYGLVTRTTDGALLANGEEKDVRTTLTGYSGQSNLGWKLRQPTSTTVDPSGLDVTSATFYNKETGAVTETRSPGGTSEAVYPPVLNSTIGSVGSENGQLSGPNAVAFQSSIGAAWIADTGNNRIEEFVGGKFQAAFGVNGSGNGQFKGPWGIAFSPGIGEYVADTGNDRVQELNSNGGYVRQWGGKGSGNGQFEEPKAVAVDSSGNVWVSDTGNNRVQEFTSSGEFVRAFGSWGSGNGQFKSLGRSRSRAAWSMWSTRAIGAWRSSRPAARM